MYTEVVVAQTSSEPCQTLLGAVNDNPQCTSLGNCTGLTCEQRGNALNGSSATFVVTKCEDPVSVDLRIQSSTADILQQTFNQSSTAPLGSGGNTLSVDMQRNASHLQFQVN